jgi:hypothetical protein
MYVCQLYPAIIKIQLKENSLNIDILMSKYKFLYDVTGINKIVKETL